MEAAERTQRISRTVLENRGPPAVMRARSLFVKGTAVRQELCLTWAPYADSLASVTKMREAGERSAYQERPVRRWMWSEKKVRRCAIGLEVSRWAGEGEDGGGDGTQTV